MKHLSTKLGLAFGTLALFMLISAPVFAQDGSSSTNVEAESSSGSATASSTSTETTGGDTHGSSHGGSTPTDTHTSVETETGAETHLNGSKLTFCENHKDAISAIMSRIADRGQKQTDLFTTIATRVETFYTQSGKTVNNYNTLVADVNAKHTAAQTAVNTIKADSTTFTCTSTNPQGMVSTFKNALKTEIAALQAYRMSVRNLTVAVKSVVETSSSSTTTGGNQ